MTLPGISFRAPSFDRRPCTNSLLGSGRAHMSNDTSRPPLSTLWYPRPSRVWDICDIAFPSSVSLSLLGSSHCGTHSILIVIIHIFVKDNEQNTAGRGEQNRLLTLTQAALQYAFHTKFAHLNVKLPIAHTQTASSKICIFQTKPFLNSPPFSCFLQIHVNMPLLFTIVQKFRWPFSSPTNDFILRNSDGPSLHERTIQF